MDSVLSKFTVPQLYDAFASAETGSFQDPWIRTKYRPQNNISTAFGPVQLTQNLVQDYADRGLLSPESQQFYADVMWPRYNLMRNPTNPDFSAAYDYGGGAEFTNEVDKAAYRKMAEEILGQMAKTRDLDSLIQRWRGVPRNADPRYYNQVTNTLGGR